METMKKAWIGPLVEAALQNCLETVTANSRPSSKPAWIAGSIQDDESNFRVPVRSPKCVQVVNWSRAKAPRQGVLSDSFSIVKAIFASGPTEECSSADRENSGRVARGSILKITEFEVVISHVTTTAPTLYIQVFEVCGCEDAGIFGNPVPIEGNRTVMDSALKICRAKDNQDEKGSVCDGEDDNELDDGDDDEDAASARPYRQPKPTHISSDQSSILNSAAQEACFATQIPSERQPGQLKTIELKDNSGTRSNSRDYLLSHLSSNKINHANSAPRASSRPLQTSTPERAGTATSTGNTPTAALERGRSCQEPSSRRPANCQDRRPESPNAHPPSTDTNEKLTSGPASETTETRRNIREDAANNPSSPPRNANVDQDIELPARPRDSTSQKGIPVTGEQATESRSNLNTTHDGSGKRARGSASETRGNNTWKRWKRIRRHDIMIPPDQEELIENSASWVPPETGKQMPQAHVPVTLLRQWNEVHAKRLSAETNPPAQPSEQVVTNESPSELATASSSPSPTPLDSQEWPPSSPAGRGGGLVPADSSPPPRISRDRVEPASRHDTSKCQGQIDTHSAAPNRDGDDANVLQGTFAANGAAKDRPLTTVGTDDSESEMEISVPKGSGTMSSQGKSVSAGNGLSNSTAQFPSMEEAGGNHVDQSVSSTSGRPGSSQRYEEDGIVTAMGSTRNRPQQISSDVLVPATYGSGDISYQSQHLHLTQPDISQDFTATEWDKAVEKQLTSELDSASSSANMPGQHDPLKAGVAISQNQESSTQGTDKDALPRDDTSDVEEAQVEATPYYNKRKLHGSASSRPKKLRKLTEEASDPDPDTSRRFAEQKSHGAESRRAYFSGVADSAARTAYNDFKRTYPNYEGDIKTFKRSCRNLQLLCAQGDLKRSSLWDDYVGREVTEYRDYLNTCLRQNKPPDPYNTYFVNNATHPRFKKRNLHPKRVAAVVEDNEIVESEEEPESHAPHGNGNSSSGHDPQHDDSRSDVGPDKEVSNLQPPDQVAESSDRKVSDGAEDAEWDECDDVHETASIELGDPDDRDEGQSFPADMEDENTVVDTTEEAVTHTKSAGHSFKYREVIEIEDSDTDTAMHKRTSGDTSPEYEATKVTKASDKEQEKRSYVGKGQEGDTSPVLGTSLYPPYKPAIGPTEDASAPRISESSHDLWWKDSNTPFKDFARRYVSLNDELGRFRRNSDKEWPPVDDDGVIIPKEMGDTQPDELVKGRMTTMGWHL